MTVRELIELLQQFPSPNLRVVIDGYEGGFHDVKAENIGLINLELDVNSEWYYGPHESVSSGEPADETALRIGKSPQNMPILELIKAQL